MIDRQFNYPIMLSLAGRRALVVGGGEVALRKARALADAGSAVRVVSPEFHADFAKDPRFECVAEPYAAWHMSGMFLAVAATDDEAVNARVASDARRSGVLVNVVDRPDLSDFIVPATVERGRLRIAISTGGASPSLARRLREKLERKFGPEYATYLDVMAEVRRDLLSRDLSPAVRRRLFERLSEDDVIAKARRGPKALRAAIHAILSGE
jgi:precorrin-2 dehydrogenase/sirohydrochlorin ferrochelatase